RPAGAGPHPRLRHALRHHHDDRAHARHPDRQHDLLRSGADCRPARLRDHRRLCQVPDARRGDRMIQAPDLPVWAAILVALLLLLGAVMTLIGTVGLLRLKSFQQRMHAPTLGSTLGTGSIVIASMICFTVLEARLMIHELLIGLFL